MGRKRKQDTSTETDISLESVMEGDEGVFDLAEKELRKMLSDDDEKIRFKAISLAPRFESMRPQKKTIVLSDEFRWIIETLLTIEERYECSAMDAVKVLRRSVDDLSGILGKHSPRNHKRG